MKVKLQFNAIIQNVESTFVVDILFSPLGAFNPRNKIPKFDVLKDECVFVTSIKDSKRRVYSPLMLPNNTFLKLRKACYKILYPEIKGDFFKKFYCYFI